MDEPTCPGCRGLLKRVGELEARHHELEAQLSRNTSNSSIPPSANPPQAPPVRQEGVEPTNKHIERQLRPGVLWRKNAFGCQSETGCRYVERMLTVVQTLRLQQRPVLAFLYQSVLAHRDAQPAPRLLGVQ